MRASVFIATSLDGFIARQDGALDWLPHDGGEPHGYDEFIASVDAIVIGRNTFETVLTFDTWPYGTTPVVVLSTRPAALKAPEGAVCDMMAGTPPEVVHLAVATGTRPYRLVRHPRTGVPARDAHRALVLIPVPDPNTSFRRAVTWHE